LGAYLNKLSCYQEEITDPEKHESLLKNFGVEEKKKRIKEKTLPVEPTDKELDGGSTPLWN
jgi:hypothetical protein